MSPPDFANRRFLIVAGQPKAGTTSVFDWLAQHPEVCGTRTKEARFFLDADYPLPRSLGFDGNNLSRYAELFEDPAKPVLLDATPDYMFNRTFLQVAQLLPNARVVVLTRAPAARVASAFQFFSQRGSLPSGWRLRDYVQHMIDSPVTADTPTHFRVLDHCRSAHLDRLRESFGDRLLVIDFNALNDAPADTYAALCSFAGLVPDPAVELSRRNPSRGARFPWLSRIAYAVEPRLVYLLLRLKLDALLPLLRRFNRFAKRLITKEAGRSEADEVTRGLIADFLARTP